jgi:dihydroorotate dehydrogenase/Pyruvate/2-oxoacid:ferredoxin oxidoreductase delta subunit
MADLHTVINGIHFANPVLPAAGPNVRTGRLMAEAAAGGAGGIVAKTISTAAANDKRPSIRRMTNGGLVNCETWSEIPVEEFLTDLAGAKATGLPLIVSIGYSPEDVHLLGSLIEREIAPDAFEFSTHYTGRGIDPLVDVARSLRETVDVPIWMKISPGFPDIDMLAAAAAPFVDAFVAINSVGPVLDFDPENPERILGSLRGTGWMSGPPIRPIALEIVNRLAASFDKPVIGVGGVEPGRDAIQFLMAGAVAVEVCTAAIEKGNGVYGTIASQIGAWLDEHGYSSPEQIRGAYRASMTLETAGDSRETEVVGVSPIREARMTVIPDLCTACKACVSRCVQGAISMDEIAQIDVERCIGCGYCQDSCRFGAMSLKTVS